MKKIIPFIKDIKFNTKIYEITSISLENTLTTLENGEIDGEFIVSGDYKMNDTSINTEPFIYGLPFNITIDDYYDIDSLKIDIDDFKYEIINEEILRVNIDVSLDGKVKVEVKKDKEKDELNKINPDVIIETRINEDKNDNINEVRNKIDISDDIIDEYVNIKDNETNQKEEITDLFKQNKDEIKKVSNEVTINNKIDSIFENFSSEDEKYVSYYVHIVRDNDTLESISIKYNVPIEDIKEYNDVENITHFSKLIVPYIDDKKI